MPSTTIAIAALYDLQFNPMKHNLTHDTVMQSSALLRHEIVSLL